MRLNEWFKPRHALETGYRPAKTGPLVPICASDSLLAEHETLIWQIAALAGVPDGHFEHLYLAALKAYAGFVQRLPVSQAHPTTICLGQTLTRLVRTLGNRQGYLLPAEAEAEVIAAKADLWTYAVFTACLLQDIDQTVIGRNISLFDQDRHPLGRWNPFSGMMTAPAVWYRVDSVSSPSDNRRRVAPLLARFILPPIGLHWLWGDDEALRGWFGSLIGDPREAGAFDEIIGVISTSSLQ